MKFDHSCSNASQFFLRTKISLISEQEQHIKLLLMEAQ
jgi:hypothetical protein